MRRFPLLRILPFVSICLLSAAALSAQTAGGTRGSPGRPPTRGPESGLLGGKGPTTRPGSHETSAKDERDRVAGKFPAPKEKGGSEEDRRPGPAPFAAAVHLDAVALDAERQALTLTGDDFRVTIDGGLRKVISAHYVFRGPDALGAGRSLALGPGVFKHADEARTIVLAVDESTFQAGAERAVQAELEHVLDIAGSVDRVAVLTLPQAGTLRFAGTRADLMASVARVTGRRRTGSDPSLASLDALARVLKDLVKLEGPKSVILFTGAPSAAARRVSDKPNAEAAAVSAILDAAAASRSVLHVVIPREAPADAANTYLRTLARSTGGTVTRLTGDPNDLAPLAAPLLGGYIFEVEGRVGDRDGTPHALSVTTSAKGVRILAPSRWMPRSDPLPPPVPPGSIPVKGGR